MKKYYLVFRPGLLKNDDGWNFKKNYYIFTAEKIDEETFYINQTLKDMREVSFYLGRIANFYFCPKRDEGAPENQKVMT